MMVMKIMAKAEAVAGIQERKEGRLEKEEGARKGKVFVEVEDRTLIHRFSELVKAKSYI